MERVRKNEQNKLPKRHRKYYKKSRHLLMKPMERLTDDEMYRLALMFEIAPRLADAYRIKNDFLSAICSKSAAEGKKALADWLLSVEVMDLLEFHDCTKAYHNWFNEIIDPWKSHGQTALLRDAITKPRSLNAPATVCVTSIISGNESCFAIHKIVPEPKLRHDP